MKKIEIISVLITSFLLLLAMIRNLNIFKMWVFADLFPFPLDVSQRIDETFYLWSIEGLGGLVSPMTNIIRFAFIAQLFFDPVIAQKVIIFLPFIVSFLSFFVFIRHFGLSIVSSYMGALIYSINPTILSLFLVGEAGTLMISAIFPLFTIFLNNFLFSSKKSNWKYLAAIGIVSFLFFWNLYYAFWFGVFSLLFLICINFGILKQQNLKCTPSILKRLCLLLIVIFLITLPSLVVFSLLNQDISHALDLSSQTAYSYGDATVLNLIRLSGNKGSPQVSGYLNYNSFNEFTIFGIILTLVTSLSLIMEKKKSNLILLYSACLLFLSVIGFIILIKSAPYITESLPLFSTLRNPSKLMLPLVFFFAIMFSITVENLANRNGKSLALIAIPLIIIVLFFYNYPLLDGTLGIQKMRGSVYIPNNYEIDEKYSQLKQLLSSSDVHFNDFYILYLPWERFSKNTICRIFPNYFGSGSSGASTMLKGFGDIYEVLAANPKDKAEFLEVFNVKYIIIDKTFKSMFPSVEQSGNISVIYDNLNLCWFTGAPQVFHDIFVNDENFKLIYDDENFWVFSNEILKEPRTVYADNSEALNKSVDLIVYRKNLLSASFENNLDNFSAVGSYGFINDSVEANFSIFLLSTSNDWPHIYRIVPIDEKEGEYTLSFQIKGFNITNLHAKILWYNFVPESYQGDTDAIRTDYIRIYEGNIKEGEWYTAEKVLIPPANAKTAIIVIFGSQAVSKTKSFSETMTLIDAISFDFHSVESTLDISYIEGSRVLEYESVNPTLTRVKVNVTKPFILALNEIYNPQWVASTDDGNRSNSIMLYGLVNGFYINKTGEYILTIEYEPQKWFFYASIISLTTFLTCTAYLAYTYTKTRKTLHKLKQKLTSLLAVY